MIVAWLLKDPLRTAGLAGTAVFAVIALVQWGELTTLRADARVADARAEAAAAVAKAKEESARLAVDVAGEKQEMHDAETARWKRTADERYRDVRLCWATRDRVPGIPDDPAGGTDADGPVVSRPVGGDINELVARAEGFRSALARCYATLDANAAHGSGRARQP